MKKHIKSIFLMGIVIFHSTQISAIGIRDGIIGACAVLSGIQGSITNGLSAAGYSAIAGITVAGLETIKENMQTFFKPKLEYLTHEELALEPDVDTQSELPHDIRQINYEEEKGNQGYKLLILSGKPGVGKTALIKKDAYHTGGKYYHIHEDSFAGYSDKAIINCIKFYADQISREAQEGEIPTLHLEEFGKRLGTSGNPAIDAKRVEYMDSWKRTLDYLRECYPNLKIRACSNHGSNDQQKYNDAIADRSHILQIKEPNKTAREDYLKRGCIEHFQTAGEKHARNAIIQKDKTSYNQEIDINQRLQNEFHVTEDMLQAAATKHQNQIDSLRKLSWTYDVYLQPELWSKSWNDDKDVSLKPWLWSKAWSDNQAARKLEEQGYVTPVVTHTIQPTIKQIDAFAQATNDVKSYRRLKEDISEIARIAKLSQIEQMQDRIDNPYDQNAATTYTVNKADRTCTVTHKKIDGDKNNEFTDYNEKTKKYTALPKTITYNYGDVKASHVLLAAQQKHNEAIEKNRKKELESSDDTIVRDYAQTTSPEQVMNIPLSKETKLEFMKEYVPTSDIVGFSRRLVINDAEKPVAESSVPKLSVKERIQKDSTLQAEIAELKAARVEKKAAAAAAATMIQAAARKRQATKKVQQLRYEKKNNNADAK